jgi:hypothetical protein
VRVICDVETRDREHIAAVVERLVAEGIPCRIAWSDKS